MWQRLSRLLPAPHCSLHPCRDVACSYLGRRRGRLTGRILLLKLLLLLLLLCALLPVVPVVLPAAGHPCPCMGVPCWAYHCTAYPWSVSSPAPPGACFLNHRVPRLPQEAAVLACQEVLHWLQRWWELPGISWMNKQGQLARAGPGGIRRGTVGAVSPAALTGVSDRDSPAMLPLPAESCKKSGANHVEIFTRFLPFYTIIQQSFSSSWDHQEPGLALQQQAVPGTVCKYWGATGAAGRATPLPPVGISQYKCNATAGASPMWVMSSMASSECWAH